MNDNFKAELTAFMQDINAICESNTGSSCKHCPLWDSNERACMVSPMGIEFIPDQAIAAVEAYRKRKKPCAEVIDRALDVYTIEVEVERKGAAPNSVSEKHYADALRKHLIAYYGQVINGSVVVRVLSAKRFALQSHREEEE